MPDIRSDGFSDLVRADRKNRSVALLRAATELYLLDADHDADHAARSHADRVPVDAAQLGANHTPPDRGWRDVCPDEPAHAHTDGPTQRGADHTTPDRERRDIFADGAAYLGPAQLGADHTTPDRRRRDVFPDGHTAHRHGPPVWA